MYSIPAQLLILIFFILFAKEAMLHIFARKYLHFFHYGVNNNLVSQLKGVSLTIHSYGCIYDINRVGTSRKLCGGADSDDVITSLAVLNSV